MLYTVDLSQDIWKENKYISSTLQKKIEETLKKKEKVLLYINKRWGYSSLVCEDCSFLYGCHRCDVSLSVHTHPDKLVCHMCGYEESFPLSCSKCTGTHLRKVWVGTQQIEWSLKKLFPHAQSFRFDSDVIDTKTSKSEALKKLQESDIIIGTKMLTTGFDLPNVGLIAVILLEQELSFPQYNREEKLYTSLKQLSGRGERKGQETDIILQTFIPKNPLIHLIVEGNYKVFLTETLRERKEFEYPPFTQMATLDYRDMSKEKSLWFMQSLENKLRNLNYSESVVIILNPTPFKKNNQYHTTLLLKTQNIRKFLTEVEAEILRNPKLSLILE